MRLFTKNWVVLMISGITFLMIFFAWSCKDSDYRNNQQDNSIPFSVMSFNVLYSTSVESTIKSILSTGCDIIGVQEASGERIKQVANSLDFYYHSFDKNSGNLSPNDTGILSRYPIKNKLNNVVIIQLPDGEEIAVLSVHLSPYPYEPYDIRDDNVKTPGEAVNSASQTRIPEIHPILETIDSLIKTGLPVFLTGDFNEPSYLDWTKKSAKNNMHFSMAVEWPCSKAINDLGLKDAYRMAFPDEVSKNGITWTTNRTENEVYDRIDFVYYNIQNKWKLNSVKRVGRPDNNANIKIQGYESDHFAVIASYSPAK